MMMGQYANRMHYDGGLFSELFGLLFVLFWIFALIDVVLLAFWLWRQLMKK